MPVDLRLCTTHSTRYCANCIPALRRVRSLRFVDLAHRYYLKPKPIRKNGETMPRQKEVELPFSARYSLPAQLSASLGEVSWESVAQLSTEFQVRIDQKSSRVKKIIKEIQMSRLLLLDRIRQGTRSGKIDPKLLVDITRLLQRCEEVAEQYDIDLREYSTFLFLISEKLKKEKLDRISGHRELAHLRPIPEGFDNFKEASANAKKKKGKKKG